MVRVLCASLILLVTGIQVGCQQRSTGPHRVKLSGSVTWNGTPIENGTVHLVPENESQGTLSGGEIKNGHYNVTNKGGVIPGEYRVEVTALRSIPPVVLADGSELNVEQYIPKKFNANSVLKLSVPSEQKSLEHNLDLKD